MVFPGRSSYLTSGIYYICSMNLVICYMLPCFVAVLGAALVALREPHSPARDLMSGMLALLAVCIACYAQLFSPWFMHVIWFDLVFKSLAPFCASLYILYVVALTSVEGVSRSTVLVCVLPPVLYSLLLFCTAFSLTSEESLCYIGKVVQAEGTMQAPSRALKLMTLVGTRCFSVLFPSYAVGALLWSVLRLRSYYRMLNDFYSSSSQVQRSYGWSLILIFAMFVPVAAFLMFVPHYASVPRWVPWVLVSVESLLLLIVTLVASIFRFTAADLREALESHRETVRDGSQSKTMQQISELLDTAVRETKVYLDPTLTVISFAQIIGTNRTYLQSAIKEKYDCTFSEFINRCRVDHAKSLLRENPRLPLKDVSIRSGFNSLSSFHRNFQEFENMTPTQWVKELM